LALIGLIVFSSVTFAFSLGTRVKAASHPINSVEQPSHSTTTLAVPSPQVPTAPTLSPADVKNDKRVAERVAIDFVDGIIQSDGYHYPEATKHCTPEYAAVLTPGVGIYELWGRTHGGPGEDRPHFPFSRQWLSSYTGGSAIYRYRIESGNNASDFEERGVYLKKINEKWQVTGVNTLSR